MTTLQITTGELRTLIADVVEQKLLEFFGDPDTGLDLRAEVQSRLASQREAVATGERGRSLADV